MYSTLNSDCGWQVNCMSRVVLQLLVEIYISALKFSTHLYKSYIMYAIAIKCSRVFRGQATMLETSLNLEAVSLLKAGLYNCVLCE